MNRRDFLKMAGATVAGLAIIPFINPMKAFAGTGTIPINDHTKKREWIIRWSQWVWTYPDSISPILDEDGELLARNQPPGQKTMFFLTGGNKSEKLIRHINISRHSYIMFPIIMGTWTYSASKANNDEQIIQEMRDEIDTTSILIAKLDGKDVPYERIDSGELHPQYNAKSEHFETDAGFSRAFTDGYWVFLDPLSVGTHSIYLKGRLEKALDTKKPYQNEVTYDITIT